jgi:hypothetical protein
MLEAQGCFPHLKVGPLLTFTNPNSNLLGTHPLPPYSQTCSCWDFVGLGEIETICLDLLVWKFVCMLGLSSLDL